MSDRRKFRFPALARKSNHGTSKTQDGFALVTVIWITGILATAAFVATSAATSRLGTVDALIASAEAEAAADAGVTLAIASITARENSGQSTSFFTPAIVCRLNDRMVIRVDVSDEAGKVDLNFASDDVLRALMIGLGWPSDRVETHIAALQDYIDGDSEPRANGGEAPQYRDAALASRPRNGQLASIFELGQVIGFDTKILSDIYPHVTVYSGQSGVDPQIATPELQALLQSGSNNEALDTSKRVRDTPSLPMAFRTASTQHAMTVTSQGVSTRGARFIREAVVSFAPTRSAKRASQYRIWRWTNGVKTDALETLDVHGDLRRC